MSVGPGDARLSTRARSFKEEDELNTWFAADPMVMKVRSIAEQLTELGDTVKADELLSKLRRYNRKMIFKGSKLKRPRVSHHPRRSTMMRPRQVNKAAVAGINRVQTNHHRKVISKLLKID